MLGEERKWNHINFSKLEMVEKEWMTKKKDANKQKTRASNRKELPTQL